MSVSERFWAKTEPDNDSGCVLWRGALNTSGYGWLTHNRKQTGAHRMAWMLVCGEIPEGMHVLHRCDVRNCVNPNHLYLGVHADNMRDRAARQRMWGQQPQNRKAAREIAFRNLAKRRKLTEADVAVIRRLRAEGVPGADIAARFGTTRNHIYNIARGKAWASTT